MNTVQIVIIHITRLNSKSKILFFKHRLEISGQKEKSL